MENSLNSKLKANVSLNADEILYLVQILETRKKYEGILMLKFEIDQLVKKLKDGLNSVERISTSADLFK